MSKIDSWFWGGQDARFFRENKAAILAFNTRVIGIVNGMMAVIALLYFIFDLNSGSSVLLRYSCLSCSAVMMLAYLIHTFLIKKQGFPNRVYSIVVIELVFIFLLLVGPVYDSSNIACYLPVFFILLPIILIENYYVILGIALIDFAVFGTVDWICKSSVLATYDIIDAATCLLLGIAVGHSVLKNRLSEISAYGKLKKQSETELAKALALANRDPLTGVKSRAAFESSMAGIQETIDADTAEPFALIVCDVNDMKKVNDSLGHEAGDRLLIECCRLICVTFKRSPVFRIGGDEFAVLLTGSDYAERDRLLREFREARVHGLENRIVALGFSEYRAGVDHRTSEAFIRADAEMYRDKALLKRDSGQA